MTFKPSAVEQKICQSLAELDALGIQDAPRVFVAFFAGYSSVKTKTFSVALTNLKQNGFVAYSKGSVRLTDLGKSLVTQGVEPPKSNEEMHERLCEMLRKLHGSGDVVDKIFDTLSDGKAHKAIDVAVAAGYSSLKTKSFSSALSKMKDLGLLERSGKGAIQLTGTALPFGRK